MPALESDLRRQLESVIIQARGVAEAAARSALQKRAVDAAEPFAHFGPKEKELRNRLRARGRQVGDVRLEIDFAPEQRLALERLLAGLPRETFLADDSFGWVYQFWQTKQKDEVNKTGEKIDGTTLPAVTQLFTEHYMVQFLLHNTIGAWWCARHGIKGPAGGAGAPVSQAPVEMEYLRWRDDG